MPESIDRAQLRDAFQRLATLLGRDGTVREIYISGGAAMVLVYRWGSPGRPDTDLYAAV